MLKFQNLDNHMQVHGGRGLGGAGGGGFFFEFYIRMVTTHHNT